MIEVGTARVQPHGAVLKFLKGIFE